jgi:hypothetical protein
MCSCMDFRQTEIVFLYSINGLLNVFTARYKLNLKKIFQVCFVSMVQFYLQNFLIGHVMVQVGSDRPLYLQNRV